MARDTREFAQTSLAQAKTAHAAAKVARKASSTWSQELVDAEKRAKVRVAAAEKLLERSGNLT